MAQQTINVGTAPNDGTGTPLRTAFQYTNSNFSELYTAVGPSGNNIVVPGNATITGDLTVDTSTLKVDSANDKVGVGTTSPGAKLTVAGASEALRLCNAAPYLTFYNAAQSSRFGYIQHNGTNLGIVNEIAGSLELYTNNTLQATLNSTGLGVGVTPSAGGGCLQLKSGITFPATQVASSDANTLDDYEEGNWTGTLKGSTSDPTTPVTATGKYTKIGRQVMVQIYFNGNTTGASSRIFISGLPFAASSAPPDGTTGSILMDAMGTFTGSPTCWTGASGTTMELYQSISNGATASVVHNPGANRSLWASLTYTV